MHSEKPVRRCLTLRITGRGVTHSTNDEKLARRAPVHAIVGRAKGKDRLTSQQAEIDAEEVTQWFLIERESNANAPADLIARLPQFEQQISEMDAFCKIDETLPDRELTPEEEGRAIATGRGGVKSTLTGRRMGWDEAPEWAAAWIESPLSGESNERTIEFDSNMTMSLRAAEKLACARPTLPFSGAARSTPRLM